MAWLKVDDGLAEHRKILQLKRSDRWTWMEILCYVARQNNGGHVPQGIGSILRYAKPELLERFHQIGLLDIEPDTGVYVVHDWELYNGRHPDARVAAYLDQNPGASANDVYRAIGGHRESVLKAVRGYREGSTK